MSRKLLALSTTASLMGGVAFADVPTVAVDIAPVHSLVARVMEGVGTPALVIPAGASPHEYTLRPSEAQALQDADLVFWMGSDLTPWLDGAIDTLAANAAVVSLLEADGITLLDFREDALFEAHDHGDHGDHDDHGHDDHADDDHGHDDHAKDDHDHAEHGHDGTTMLTMTMANTPRLRHMSIMMITPVTIMVTMIRTLGSQQTTRALG